jgi:hypothetical protein
MKTLTFRPVIGAPTPPLAFVLLTVDDTIETRTKARTAMVLIAMATEDASVHADLYR